VKYETLSARKASEQKFWHMDSLRTLGLLDDVVALHRNLGWMDYVAMKCISYDWLISTFLSSLHVDWVRKYNGEEVLISFRMFNMDHRMSLRGFSEFFHFLVYKDSFPNMLTRWRPNLIWLSATCSKQKTNADSFWRPNMYEPKLAKATDICNINICYLQRLIANTIFWGNDNQNV